MSFITQLWQGVRETGRGSVTDAKNALESRVSSISRRPICLLKCPFPRGPGRENAGEVTAPTRTAPSSLRQTTQRRRVGKINPRQRARRGSVRRVQSWDQSQVTEARRLSSKDPSRVRSLAPADPSSSKTGQAQRAITFSQGLHWRRGHPLRTVLETHGAPRKG